MKQSGQTWISSEGKSSEAKYIPEYEKAAERTGQKIAALAEALESQVTKTKDLIGEMVNEMYARYLNNKKIQEIGRFSFTTFDRGFKIEVDVKERNYRVYKATKENPTAKDYRLLNLDFARALKLEEYVLEGNTAPADSAKDHIKSAPPKLKEEAPFGPGTAIPNTEDRVVREMDTVDELAVQAELDLVHATGPLFADHQTDEEDPGEAMYRLTNPRQDGPPDDQDETDEDIERQRVHLK